MKLSLRMHQIAGFYFHFCKAKILRGKPPDPHHIKIYNKIMKLYWGLDMPWPVIYYLWSPQICLSCFFAYGYSKFAHSVIFVLFYDCRSRPVEDFLALSIVVRLVWTIWTSMSAVLKKAVKLNHSLTLNCSFWSPVLLKTHLVSLIRFFDTSFSSYFRIYEGKQWGSCDFDSNLQRWFGACPRLRVWRIIDSDQGQYWRRVSCGKLSSDSLCSRMLLWIHKGNAVTGKLCEIFQTCI